jgi:hypothetical protein
MYLYTTYCSAWIIACIYRKCLELLVGKASLYCTKARSDDPTISYFNISIRKRYCLSGTNLMWQLNSLSLLVKYEKHLQISKTDVILPARISVKLWEYNCIKTNTLPVSCFVDISQFIVAFIRYIKWESYLISLEANGNSQHVQFIT